MQCSECESAVYAHGLCQKHYWRKKRTGTTERTRLPAQGPCKADGCERKAFAKGYCSMHYQRLRAPLYTIWRNLRAKYPGAYDPCWDDREAFIDDVGMPPLAGSQLRRIDKSRPWSKDNCEWREPVGMKTPPKGSPDWAKYQLAWKYMRKFGLTMEDVDRMLAEQNGECPICLMPLMLEVEGKPVKVCLDHDHKTGLPREFLHDNCNKGIGQLADEPERCERAAAYLRKHHAEK